MLGDLGLGHYHENISHHQLYFVLKAVFLFRKRDISRVLSCHKLGRPGSEAIPCGQHGASGAVAHQLLGPGLGLEHMHRALESLTSCIKKHPDTLHA